MTQPGSIIYIASMEFTHLVTRVKTLAAVHNVCNPMNLFLKILSAADLSKAILDRNSLERTIPHFSGSCVQFHFRIKVLHVD